jgi:predicted lysophospholipase L1 biosynthesis ABC-type transport system permease subunit
MPFGNPSSPRWNESKELLGADLALRARRSITDEELEQPAAPCPRNQGGGGGRLFFHGRWPTGRSRLVKVVAYDPGFPFHGTFKLQKGGEKRGTRSNCPRAKAGLDLSGSPGPAGNQNGGETATGRGKFRISDLIGRDRT